MKKRLIILLFSLIVLSYTVYAGDIYLHLLTTGQPVASYYLGDQFTSDWYINMEVGLTEWNATDIGIGTSILGTGENWADAEWYENGTGSNKRVQRSLNGFQFTSTGSWYFYGRAKAEETDVWHYANNGVWGNTSSFGPTEYFTVNALNTPTLSSVSKHSTYSSTDIVLSLTEDAQAHNIMIVRREGSAVTFSPDQGTSYTGGQDLGNNQTVVNGSYDASANSNSITDNYLNPGTTYYYKIFSENNGYYSTGVEAATSYVTTDALPKPTGFSATMKSDSKIKLEWTADSNYNNVMITARKGTALSADPVNETEYSVSDPIGDGAVIYMGTASDYTYSGLDGNSTYFFRIYTAESNSDYYSSTDASTTKTAATHDGTTYHTIEFTGNSNDFSSSENVSGSYYLSWDNTYLYAAEFINIDLSSSTDKFVVAIDIDPGTANGYAPPDWGGYNFAANNDGTHNLEYILAMGNGYTNLYTNGDNFTSGADKSGYTQSIGTHAEIAIPWSDLGGKPADSWEIAMWYSNSSNTWTHSVFPSSNPTEGDFPLEITSMQQFGSADEGVSPNSVAGDTPLPVTLSSFSAVFDGSNPVLNWSTASEINNAGWNIYRSEIDDISLGMQINMELIAGAGTTTSLTEYSYSDPHEFADGATYYYWLESIDISSNSQNYGPISLLIPLEEEEEEAPVPAELYGLHDNYPNPFNPDTMISFMLNYDSRVTLEIYNLKGRKIMTILDKESVSASEMQFAGWNGKDESGNECSSGIYLYKLTTDREVLSRKMSLIK